VNALLFSYLLPLITDEIFAFIEVCEQRLRGFALAEEFDITYTGKNNKRIPGDR
jgi:hypothetical protein